ncbi:unnamed protein product [Tenebrio molitor]|nr:unnamed protein product [Tenebrio molitor]
MFMQKCVGTSWWNCGCRISKVFADVVHLRFLTPNLQLLKGGD